MRLLLPHFSKSDESDARMSTQTYAIVTQTSAIVTQTSAIITQTSAI